jgi:hypothetical protein
MGTDQDTVQPGAFCHAALIGRLLAHQATSQLAALSAHRVEFRNYLGRILQRERFRLLGVVHADRFAAWPGADIRTDAQSNLGVCPTL